jgi:LPS export ABC transporter protein LptC
MNTSSWQFLISKRHTRLQRLWQSFFAGWGLFLTIILLASPFIFQNMTLVILDAIDMASIEQNNLSVKNLKLNGINKNGDPFSIRAQNALQKFNEPNATYFTNPIANLVRMKDGAKIHDKITAKTGKFLNDQQKIILSKNVKVDSSDGTTASANEMEIDLKE